MLREIRDPLFCYNNIGLELQDVFAHLLDLILFLLQQQLPILLPSDFHVGGGLRLLVLKGTIQQDHPGLLDSATHLRVNNILVEHDPFQHLTILHAPAGDFLDSRVPLHVNDFLAANGLLHDLGSPDRQVTDLTSVAGHELGVHTLPDAIREGLLVRGVQRGRHLLHNLDGVFQSPQIGLHDHCWVEWNIQQRLGNTHHLSSKNNYGGRAITHLFILGPGELHHALCGGMSHINLSQNRVAVVREDDATHWVQEHLQHRLGSQRRAHDIGHSHARRNVRLLSLAILLALHV
mmetsp:Transcript_56532/g.123921  ORF Transcript_56532/g.123921 Transcript_56532/m.123921 type:complete len:291 (-) Transcript_56532:103-975(-)